MDRALTLSEVADQLNQWRAKYGDDYTPHIAVPGGGLWTVDAVVPNGGDGPLYIFARERQD